MVIIPSTQMTLTEKMRLRKDAIDKGILTAQRELNKDKSQLEYRHAQTALDFGTVGRNWWASANLAVVNTYYSMFTTLAAPAVGLTPTLANNKVAVFYNASIATSPNPVSLLQFAMGAVGSVSRNMAVFDLEQIENQDIVEGYFSSPLVYIPQDILNISVLAKRATAAPGNIILGCIIIEPKGVVTA